MTVLPLKCRRYLIERDMKFDEVVIGGQKAVILRGVILPAGRFDSIVADILVLLPGGYPDSPPDMFYALPWLRLAATRAHPRAADQPYSFAGQNWQRWSRHNDAWRPGIDGIWTMVKRVEAALQEAA
jgi:hypothetical protein